MRINGKTHYLWRPVDQKGAVLEVFATKRQDRKGALRVLNCAMKRYGPSKANVTDRLQWYRAATTVAGVSDRQEFGQWRNNHAENSNQPFRRREEAMARFRDIKILQKFASVHASICNRFNEQRHMDLRDLFERNRSEQLLPKKDPCAQKLGGLAARAICRKTNHMKIRDNFRLSFWHASCC